MPNIYEQHDAAFAHVSAYVIVKDGERVATIAFKSPRDGAGRLYAYVHWIGLEMVRGYAGGYGYDKSSAACAVAAHRLAVDAADKRAAEIGEPWAEGRPWREHFAAFRAALAQDTGRYWHDRLRDAGFTVLQAV